MNHVKMFNKLMKDRFGFESYMKRSDWFEVWINGVYFMYSKSRKHSGKFFFDIKKIEEDGSMIQKEDMDWGEFLKELVSNMRKENGKNGAESFICDICEYEGLDNSDYL